MTAAGPRRRAQPSRSSGRNPTLEVPLCRPRANRLGRLTPCARNLVRGRAARQMPNGGIVNVPTTLPPRHMVPDGLPAERGAKARRCGRFQRFRSTGAGFWPSAAKVPTRTTRRITPDRRPAGIAAPATPAIGSARHRRDGPRHPTTSGWPARSLPESAPGRDCGTTGECRRSRCRSRRSTPSGPPPPPASTQASRGRSLPAAATRSPRRQSCLRHFGASAVPLARPGDSIAILHIVYTRRRFATCRHASALSRHSSSHGRARCVRGVACLVRLFLSRALRCRRTRGGASAARHRLRALLGLRAAPQRPRQIQRQGDGHAAAAGRTRAFNLHVGREPPLSCRLHRGGSPFPACSIDLDGAARSSPG